VLHLIYPRHTLYIENWSQVKFAGPHTGQRSKWYGGSKQCQNVQNRRSNLARILVGFNNQFPRNLHSTCTRLSFIPNVTLLVFY
jgi:hypothetical protein